MYQGIYRRRAIYWLIYEIIVSFGNLRYKNLCIPIVWESRESQLIELNTLYIYIFYFPSIMNACILYYYIPIFA